MASYQYKDMCYTTMSQVYSARSADCETLTANGWNITCTPSATNMSVRTFTSATVSTTRQFTLPEIPCQYDLVTPTELSWAVIIVLLTAFLIKQNIRVVR